MIGKNALSYMGNPDAKDALVNGLSDTPIVNALVQIFWALAKYIGSWFWSEQAHPTETFATPPQEERNFQPL